ncbi:hypothetical protein Tco_1344682 [Tanacetum coccineum]
MSRRGRPLPKTTAVVAAEPTVTTTAAPWYMLASLDGKECGYRRKCTPMLYSVALKNWRVLQKPPDDDGIHFDIEPDTGILTAKVVDDISKHYVLMPSILPTYPTRCLVIDTLLPFSSENENKVFNYGILASNKEKSPHLLTHRGFKAF